MRPRLPVDRRHHGARLRNHPARCNLIDPVQVREVEHDAARERHGLSVIAGPGAARRHRYSEAVEGGFGRGTTSASLFGETTTSAVTASSWRFRTANTSRSRGSSANERRVVLDLDPSQARLQRCDVVRIVIFLHSRSSASPASSHRPPHAFVQLPIIRQRRVDRLSATAPCGPSAASRKLHERSCRNRTRSAAKPASIRPFDRGHDVGRRCRDALRPVADRHGRDEGSASPSR